MAIGLGRMFGIRLPQNFDSPYKAANMTEFWRRWHMTLSRFLRDYLYIGLGGNRRGPLRRHANLLITMLLGGLWHGAAWTFVFWGGLNGLYLVVNQGWRSLGISRSDLAYRSAARALTFLCAVIAWVFFRAESFEGAWTILRSMAGLGPATASLVTSPEAWLWIVGLLVAVNALPNTQEFMTDYQPTVDFEPGRRATGPVWRPTPAHALASVVITVIAVLHLSRVSEFLYYQF
jgi:D-alanyl-lipoteichoic acid acyltransferase DltB (MBOAT superfamily)